MKNIILNLLFPLRWKLRFLFIRLASSFGGKVFTDGEVCGILGYKDKLKYEAREKGMKPAIYEIMNGGYPGIVRRWKEKNEKDMAHLKELRKQRKEDLRKTSLPKAEVFVISA